MTSRLTITAVALVYLVLYTLSVAGQPEPSDYQLSGRVVDSTGAPVSYATVAWLASADTLFTVTSDNGAFRFVHLSTRKFRLQVTMKGYRPVSRTYAVESTKSDVTVPPITLQNDYQDLDPVTVSRTRPITITTDTVTYHTSAFPVRDGAAVQDILKRLPGVEVDMSGNVIVQGKIVGKVTVNGKEFFGGDVLLAIRNLPADVVDKLQIIDDYGDKARLTGIKVGEAAKVLNIVIKPDKQNGFFGHAQAGVGTEGKYAEEVFANAFHGDRQVALSGNLADNSLIGKDPSYSSALSYADQWTHQWGGSLHANLGGDAPQTSTQMTQQSYYPGGQIDQDQTSNSQSHNRNVNIGGVLTFRPEPNILFRLTPAFQQQNVNQNFTNAFSTLEQDSGTNKSTTGQTATQSKITNANPGADLYFEKTLPASRRRFSVDATIAAANSRQEAQQQTSGSTISDSLLSQYKQIFTTTNNSSGLQLSLVSTYFQPVGSRAFLELGYNARSQSSRSSKSTQAPDSATGLPVTVDSLSQQQDYRTVTQQVHVGYSAKIRSVDLSLTFDAQPSSISGTADDKGDRFIYRYTALLPKVNANWKLTPGQTLSFQYQGISTAPTLAQINPVTDITNPQYPVTGNPNLRPFYTHSASLHYEQSKLQPTRFSGFGIGIGYALTLENIIPSVIINNGRGSVIQSTTYVNNGNNTAFFSDYHFTLPSFFQNRLRITGNGGIRWNESQNLTDQQLYTSQTTAWSQSLHLQLLIPEHIEMDLQGRYSLASMRYSTSSQLPSSVQTANIDLAGQYFLPSHWILNYSFTQPYTGSGRGLQTTPASIEAGLRREFLPHNQATIMLHGYNLLNSTGVQDQSNSSSTVTQTQTHYIGRYFLLTFIWKLQRFHQ